MARTVRSIWESTTSLVNRLVTPLSSYFSTTSHTHGTGSSTATAAATSNTIMARNSTGGTSLGTGGLVSSGVITANGGITSKGSGSGTFNEVYGASATVTSTNAQSVAVGAGASANNRSVAVGRSAQTGADTATALGYAANSSGAASVAIGANATALNQGTSIGAEASSDSSISIGRQTSSVFPGISIGRELTHNSFAGLMMGRNLALAAAYETHIGWANQGTATAPSLYLDGEATGATTGRPLYSVVTAWADAATATRKSRAVLNVHDATATREFARAETDGSRGYFILACHATAPADAMLPNNSIAFWNNAGTPTWKMKDNAGSVTSGAI
jgi:hypothetical protein